jgi:enoyl-CoA hydratase/carnithine racemase
MGVNINTDAGITVVTLDWPERRNALAPAQARELADALRAAGDVDDGRVVILTGNGGFCAGGDLRALVELAAEGREAVREVIYSSYHAVIRSLIEMPKPVLAAIDGPAIGIGMDMALACDWRAIGPHGWLRHGWTQLGVIPGTGGELLLRRLSPTLTWSLLGTSTRIDADQAAALGLAQLAPADALETAHERAAALATLTPAALEGYVRLYRDELRAQLDRHFELCIEIQSDLVATEQFRERATALLAKA